MKKRPETTLFMLMSADGKITSGPGDALDADRDWCRIEGVREGLHQYYALEQQTALWSLNTGKVMRKIGVNERTDVPRKMPVSFVIWDAAPHLTRQGVEYLCKWVHKLVLATSNERHPAYGVQADNLEIVRQPALDLPALLQELASRYGVEEITIQSGGSLNGAFLRGKLLDNVDIVLAPLLVGGAETPTLVDGNAITRPEQLDQLGALRLVACDVLEDSYVRLRYKVIT